MVTVLDDLSGFFEAGHLSAIMGAAPQPVHGVPATVM